MAGSSPTPFASLKRKTKPKATPPPALLQGTLDLMVLKTIALSPGGQGEHGYGIARRIHQQSSEVLLVEEGSLYPALHRLEKRGLISATWKQSETNRRAKYYRITAAGRRQLRTDEQQWNVLASAINRVLGTPAI